MKPAFRWPPARLKLLKRLYLVDGLKPAAIAEQFGDGCSARAVTAKIAAQGWARQRADHRYTRWSPERLAELRRLYIEEGFEADQVARRMGLPEDPVRRRIVQEGLYGELPPHERRRRHRLASEKGEAAKVAGWRRVGRVVWSELDVARLRKLYLDDDLAPGVIAAQLRLPVRAVRRKVRDLGLFAEKVAKGGARRRVARAANAAPATPVTVLPPGAARGLSRWEQDLWTAPAPDTAKAAAYRARANAKSTRNSELRRTAEVEDRRLQRQERRLLA